MQQVTFEKGISAEKSGVAMFTLVIQILYITVLRQTSVFFGLLIMYLTFKTFFY